MSTNILAILTRMNVGITTFTNASWTDTFTFYGAGSATPHANPGNIGNGALSVISVTPHAPLGGYSIQFTSTTQFSVYSPDGTLMAIGQVGVPLFAGGVTFSMNVGTIAFAANDSFALGVLPSPLDVTGVSFTLTVRASLDAATPALIASTSNGLILNGGGLGQAAMIVPTATMKGIPAGSYVYDLLASADGFDVVAYQGVLTHTQGVSALTP